jgi:hypothetical protein
VNDERKVDTSGWRCILKHEDDYVESVTGTGHDAAPTYFAFTKDRKKAKVFTYDDLYHKQAVNPTGIEFSRGFTRGEVIRVDSERLESRETSPKETLYERSVRETSPTGKLDPDLERFARGLIASKSPTTADLNTALAQLRAHEVVVGRGKLIVELCMKLGEE